VISTKVFSYEYDHLGRKIKYKYLLNGQKRTLAVYTYDAIGRMSSKVFSPSTPTGSKQTGSWFDNATWLTGSYPTLSDQVTVNAGHTVTIPSGNLASAGMLNDNGTLQNNGTLNLGNVKPTTTTLQLLLYQYHIRGGLKGINLDASGNLTNNIFSYRLDYETGTNGYFDGNISKQWWKSNIDGKERTFSFTYDDASRLKSSTYSSTQAGENYALNNVNYDKNGNIIALSRNGATNDNYTAFGNVDNLNYTYQSNSNKLSKIADATTGNADLGDFRDGTNTDDDYEYWQDGSLKRDKNKKIALTYNYLKLPETITFDGGRTIVTEYDAEGTKLKKIDSYGETTDYEEDDIYVNDDLYQTVNDEGRIVNGNYEYNITDHLGNLRISFRDSSGIAVPVQSLFYDSWGLSMKGMQISRNSSNFNKYQYNSKEIDLLTGYTDFGARLFDSQIGRWGVPDPLSDVSRRWSPYSYGYDNPIKFIDVDGMYVDFPDYQEINNMFKQYLANRIRQTTLNLAIGLKNYAKNKLNTTVNAAKAIFPSLPSFEIKEGNASSIVGSGEKRNGGIKITGKRGNGVTETDIAPLENIKEITKEDLDDLMGGLEAIEKGSGFYQKAGEKNPSEKKDFGEIVKDGLDVRAKMEEEPVSSGSNSSSNKSKQMKNKYDVIESNGMVYPTRNDTLLPNPSVIEQKRLKEIAKQKSINF
jgi:RHS repeat-associated protein